MAETARSLTNLQADLNVRVADTLDTDVSKRWINISWQEVLDYFPWPFLKASATGTLASDTTAQTFSSIFSVTDFGRMVQLLVGTTPYDRIDWEDKDLSGISGKYAISPDQTGIVLPGSDGGSATLKYIKRLSDLSQASDTLAAPTSGESGVPNAYLKQFEEAVLSGAASRYYEANEKFGTAQYWRAQRDNYLDSVVSELAQLSTADGWGFSTVSYNESGGAAEF